MRGVRPPSPPPPASSPPVPELEPCEPDEETASVASEPAGPRHETFTLRERLVMGCEVTRFEALALTATLFVLLWAFDRAQDAYLRHLQDGWSGAAG